MIWTYFIELMGKEQSEKENLDSRETKFVFFYERFMERWNWNAVGFYFCPLNPSACSSLLGLDLLHHGPPVKRL